MLALLETRAAVDVRGKVEACLLAYGAAQPVPFPSKAYIPTTFTTMQNCMTLLHWAVDHIEGVRTLLEAGADPDARDQPCVLRYGVSTLTISLSLTLTLTLALALTLTLKQRECCYGMLCYQAGELRALFDDYNLTWLRRFMEHERLPGAAHPPGVLACGQDWIRCTQSRGCWRPLGTSPAA